MLFRACAYCDHPNPVGTNFCNDCGAALHLQPCRQCGAVSVVKARHCPSCKSPFPERPLIDVSIPWAGELPGQTGQRSQPGYGGQPGPGGRPGSAGLPAQAGQPEPGLPLPRPSALPPMPRPPASRDPVPPPGERDRAAGATRPPASNRSLPRPAPSTASPGSPAGSGMPPPTRPQAEAAAFTRRLLEKASQSSLLGTASGAAGPRDELIIPPPSSRPRPTYPSAPEPDPGIELVPVVIGSERPSGLLSAPQYTAEPPVATRAGGGNGGEPSRRARARSGLRRAFTILALLVAGGVGWWLVEQELAPHLRQLGLTTDRAEPVPAAAPSPSPATAAPAGPLAPTIAPAPSGPTGRSTTDEPRLTAPATSAPGSAAAPPSAGSSGTADRSPPAPPATTASPATTAPSPATASPATAASPPASAPSPAALAQPAEAGHGVASARADRSAAFVSAPPADKDSGGDCRAALRALGLCDAAPLPKPSRP